MPDRGPMRRWVGQDGVGATRVGPRLLAVAIQPEPGRRGRSSLCSARSWCAPQGQPGTPGTPGTRPHPTSVIDTLFEAQLGFSTHFLASLGVVVLFVAILGQGSAGKVLMRAESQYAAHRLDPLPSLLGTNGSWAHRAVPVQSACPGGSILDAAGSGALAVGRRHEPEALGDPDGYRLAGIVLCRGTTGPGVSSRPG